MKDKTIFYVCNDPERALGVENSLENYHIVTIDNSPIVPILRDKGINVFSLAESLGENNPIFRNSYRLLKHEATQEYIENNRTGDAYIQVFKIAPNIEKIAKLLDLKLLNTSAKLNRKFENKLPQYKHLHNIGLNFPHTNLIRLKDISYDQTVEEFGKNFVVQFNRGHTGSGTIFINNSEQLEELKDQFPKRRVRISEKIEGEAWTLNACTTRFGTVYGGLSYQITGIDAATAQKGATVGNDWTEASRLASSTLSKIIDITEKAGSFIHQAGFQGLFGLDLIVNDKGEVFLIEINARQPASTGMHNKLMLRESMIPISAFHIAEFMYESDESYMSFINQFTKNKLRSPFKIMNRVKEINRNGLLFDDGAQIIIRNRTGDSLKVSEQTTVGVYDSSSYLRPDYSVESITEDEYILLHIPEGQKVSKGSELARIQSLKKLTDSGKIIDEYEQIINQINSKNYNERT
jgi:hypothetical protein